MGRTPPTLTDQRLASLTDDQRLTLAGVNISHEHDSQRWTLSYTHHTATALRRRVLAALANPR
jgi:hypothetical protein